MVSIDSSFFKLLPQKISQIFIQPPSCYLHKTAQRHLIECCVLFKKNTNTAKIFLASMVYRNWARLADGKGILY